VHYGDTIWVTTCCQERVSADPSGNRGHRPGDLPCVGGSRVGRTLRLGNARCGDQFHRTGDLRHRLRRADPPAIDTKLCTHGLLPAGLSDLDGLLADLGLVQRLGRRLGAEDGAVAGLEGLLELLDRVSERLSGVVPEVLRLPD